IEILNRRTKNNPVLIGEPGVGKTAVVEGLAQKIVDGTVPHKLQGKQVIRLDVVSLVQGTGIRGQFEERMQKLMEEIRQRKDVILFIDEIHEIVGAGSAGDGNMDAGNILKPALSRGTLHMVGATTQEEYQKHIEKDAALSRRFAKILIEEPNVEDAYQILLGLKGSYETYHNVTIANQAVRTAVKMAHRYLTSKNLPDSAIDLLDEASATVQGMVKKSTPEIITPLDQALIDGDMKKASRLLAKDVKGQ
ncbi:ATP-dependent Clp protease ATP-binding subunit, partial [Streptococcus pyogenes]